MEELLIHARRVLFVFALPIFLVCAPPLSAFAATSIGVAWDSSPDPNVVGYNLYYGAASHRYTNVISTGFDNSVGVSDLVQGTTYFFAVTAHDILGLESIPSIEVSYKALRPAAGTYSGLFYQNTEVGQTTAGYFVVTVTSLGTYSAQLLIGSDRYSFTGKLDSQGRVLQIIKRPGTGPLAIVFTVGTDQQADEIIGQVTDGTWISNLTGDRATFNARTNTAPFAGPYTLTLINQNTDPSLPAGIGYGMLRVNSSGTALFAGALPDGTKISRSALLSKNGMWPLFVPFNSGQGLMIGQVIFTNEANSDLNGSVSWFKTPNPKARYYAAGFTNQCQAIGSAYAKPPGVMTSVLHLADAQVAFNGGNLSTGFTNSIHFLLNSYVSNLSSNEMTMSFSLSSGLFHGQVRDPDTRHAWLFGGVALQKLGLGYGFLLGTNQSSQVVISP